MKSQHCQWGTCSETATVTLSGIDTMSHNRVRTEHYCTGCAEMRRAELRSDLADHLSIGSIEGVEIAARHLEAITDDDAPQALDLAEQVLRAALRRLTATVSGAEDCAGITVSIDRDTIRAAGPDVDDEDSASWLSPAQVAGCVAELMARGEGYSACEWAWDVLRRHGCGAPETEAE